MPGFIVTEGDRNNVTFTNTPKCLGHQYTTMARKLEAPKMNINGFGKRGHVRQSRNHKNEGFDGSHIRKSKSYKFKFKQNNITELLNISFPQIH